MSGACLELDHPADIWLEIRGEDLPGLFENALYALYRQITELRTVRPDRAILLAASGHSVESTLRALLSEALYRFETEGFLAAGAEVTIAETAAPDGKTEATGVGAPDGAATRAATAQAGAATQPRLQATARLWGESAERGRHPLLAEVKAVTYHRLTAAKTPDGGWRATVLFDV